MKDDMDSLSFDELVKILPKRWFEFQIEKSKQEIKHNEAYFRLLERILHEKEKLDD